MTSLIDNMVVTSPGILCPVLEYLKSSGVLQAGALLLVCRFHSLTLNNLLYAAASTLPDVPPPFRCTAYP